MARQVIDTTTNNGDYIGDPAPTAFGKVNANFVEVYALANGAMPKTGGTITGNVVIQSPNGAGLDLFSTSTNVTRVEIANGSASGRRYQLYASGSSGPTVAGSFGLLDVSEGAIVFSIDPGSRIFRQNGPINATAFNPTSSFDVKDNVEGYSGALEAISKLSVVTYNYIESVDVEMRKRVGLLSENVADAVPTAFNPAPAENESRADDDSEQPPTAPPLASSIDMMQLLAVAIRGVQELARENKMLSQRLAALEASSA
ncbi:tail fiber domain-containing protein [Xanthomonas arboricola]|uniref:tail fiber domain-containing protein n=1 Tax=Xanthomonas arboricola TaxID=56448 RepID=UPI000CEEA28D|nr:tail fiber domain-containing protein [Xanthomonas arboricola]PPU41818.1 hypothetical protein XaplCFBP3123_01375 [Xanthomonas arboricola pv. populi]